MHLPSDTVIQCNHGGRLIPDSRLFFKQGKRKLLTRASVLGGTFKGCDRCVKVEKLVSGYESEEPKSLLLRNLDFLTNSTPAGRAVVLDEPAPPAVSRSGPVLLTSLIWLCLCIAAVLATIYYYEGQLNAYQTRMREECRSQMQTLAADLTPR